jgi:uncharacterized glyoxalase superfamily protein PhnB
MTWKPKNYSTISPYLMVRDAEKTLQFMEAVFAATRLRLHPRDNGSGVAHAEARIDDSIIMMGEVPDASEAHIHVYVPNAEETFAQAVAEGGKIVQDLTRSGDGDYRGGIADGNGIVWWISTQEEYRN